MFNQGEIVIVPFPFTDLSSIKQRPVLVISKSIDNKKSDDVIVCGITSNLKNHNYSVLIDNVDLINGQIPKPSRIRIDKLFTLSQSIIKKKIAVINSPTFQKVREEFSKLI